MKKILAAILLMAGAGLALAFSYAWSGGARYEAAALQRGPIVQAVYASGTVEPSVMIPIAPRQGARLMTLAVDEGYNVKKGALLAQLEDTDILKNLEGLKSAAEVSEKEYSRRLELFKGKATSAQELDRAKAERDAALAAMQQAEAQLSYLKLVAPEDGIVIRRDGEVGEMISAGQPVFWISCCAPLRISAEVDEEDISLVSPGQAVAISADAFPGKVFHGKVQSITPKGDPVARSYRVRISIEGETPLMIGMTAETNIITRESTDALLAPAGALVDGKVWVLEGGKLKLAAVTTGSKTSEAVEITAGLNEQDTVIMNPDASLKEGASPSYSMKQWQTR